MRMLHPFLNLRCRDGGHQHIEPAHGICRTSQVSIAG
jgi:hypothetical protein